jgi:predicted nucleic acid-binding protein
VHHYLLDTNVVVVFQKAAHLPALVVAASKVSIAMVDDVYDELTISKLGRPPRAEMREAASLLGGSAIRVVEILDGSPEDGIRTKLRARGNPGPGEAASVAFAVTRDDHIVVTTDLKAVAGAAKLYAELPGEIGRVLGLHAFLRMLVARDALAITIAGEVSDAGRAESNLEPPLWWAAWFAEKNSGRPPTLPPPPA